MQAQTVEFAKSAFAPIPIGFFGLGTSWCALASLLCSLGCSTQKVNTTIFSSFSTPAHSITRLGYFVLGITGAICITLYALLVYAIVRYRARPQMNTWNRRRFSAVQK